MLCRARRKANKAGLTNIEFRRGGFLTYEHTDEPVDAIVSVVALHHLPDFWKLVGLRRLASMLKPEGRFYLFDVVFSFDVGCYASSVERFVERMANHAVSDGRRPVETHVREEHSTCAGSWRVCFNGPASESMTRTTRTSSSRRTCARERPRRRASEPLTTAARQLR